MKLVQTVIAVALALFLSCESARARTSRAPAAPAAPRAVSATPSAAFVKLEGCRYLKNASNDGDSFHVEYKNKEYIFRLYFVDTPEAEAGLSERVSEQSDYFKITPQESVRVGKIAAAFTSNKLAPKTFTVYTRWQDAMGRSRLARDYAFVIVDNENLAELLVQNGLARVFGTHANLPNGTNAKTFETHLKVLEQKAKHDRAGAWALHPTHDIKVEESWDKMFPKPASAPSSTATPSATPAVR